MFGVAAAVLASGFAKRFGADKLSTMLGGKPLYTWALEGTALCDYRAFVVRPEQLGKYSVPEHVSVLVNRRADKGMSEALKLAVSWTPYQASGLLIVLGDMPFIKPVVQKLLKIFHETGAEAVAAGLDGKPLTPAVFSRRVFQRLLNLRGDVGARGVLSEIRPVLVDVEEWMLLDVDKVEDLKEAEKRLELWRRFQHVD
ncbi:molybdopterin-guanine dinucleotide biosynthesis protein A [Candidatus Caldarchaeum subterraneum]|uniref:Molybdopterin-guanine dinucleotide biosynthesis protein A n=1 Tax=Caldiarchaeum subterraneum TaxID=311458 RepID=E6N8F4_CALS0|nr:molybdopterin-guanine dinucleotide biosynthesis protein A [Candidatus Caldarchaeum subterraneum]BAJ51289.1 molybdopterin-guanine dinucleotide biosynthesis protein A [Candidatus Caldarchaeum subterraneum]